MAKSRVRVKKGYQKNIQRKIQRKVEKDITGALMIIGDNAVEIAQETILKEWYKKYKPKKYDRTKDVLNSFCITKKPHKSRNNYKMEVGYDLKKIRLNSEKRQHTSLDGRDYRKELLTEIFEEDGLWVPVPSLIKGNRAYKKIHEGIHVMKIVHDYIKDNTDRNVTKAFKETYGTRVRVRKGGG